MLINPILSDQLLFTTSEPTFKDLILSDFSGGSETIDEILDDTLNRGILDAITVTDEGDLNITWSAGEIWDAENLIVVETTAEATPQAVTNNSDNYLKWVAGTGLTLNTTFPSGSEIGIARICAQDGDIVGIIQASILSTRETEIALALGAALPVVVVSGMVVEEDVDATNALDVKMSAGVFYAAMQVRVAPSEILSRTVNLVRHFHTGGAWDTDTNAEIDTANYDNGTNKTDLAVGKWLKSVFYYSNLKISWIYPNTYYTTQAQAIAAPLPEIPPGLAMCVPLMALVYKTDDASLPTAAGEQWIDIRPQLGAAALGTVTDHGGLAGLDGDDHTQYILHSLADAANDFLVASGADVFVKKTLAETGALLEGDIDHGNLQGLDTGADHSYIDQDVTTSGNPQFATVELGHATDTTLTRIGAGVAAIEGNNIVLVSNSVDVLDDVDTVTASPSTNDVLKWDGTNWIPGTAGDTGEFTFAIYSFSDELSVVQIGGGEWKAIDAVTFTIVYTYGPATGANITMSSDDVDLTLWAVNPLVLPSDYTSDTNASAMNYPDTVNNYIKFALSADKNGANDTDNEYVYFRNKKYYGFSDTTGQLDSTETLALSGSGFVTASVNNLDTAAHTQTPTGTQYLHFLWPDRLSPSNAGTTMFEINGFPTAFTNNGTFTFDNGVGTGYQETYIDYEAPYGYDAALTFEVKADA